MVKQRFVLSKRNDIEDLSGQIVHSLAKYDTGAASSFLKILRNMHGELYRYTELYQIMADFIEASSMVLNCLDHFDDQVSKDQIVHLLDTMYRYFLQEVDRRSGSLWDRIAIQLAEMRRSHFDVAFQEIKAFKG